MGRPRKAPSAEAEISLGFEEEVRLISIEQIVSLKLVGDQVRKSVKFRQIAASITEVGIIEPPVVSQDPQDKNRYLLLDGHLRVEILKDLGEHDVACLIAKDDETYTYNKHVSRLSTIMEHKMIAKAVGRGIAEEKIAKALNVNVASIISKKNLLQGICAEASEALKDKMVPAGVFAILRRMKPFRQFEAARLMTTAGLYSTSYARALLAATPVTQLTNPEKPKKIRGLDAEQMARMETEMTNLQREFSLVEENYGTDVLNLTLAKGYLSSLLGNAKIVRYLAQSDAEILAQFQKISEMTSLGGKEPTT